MLRGFPARFEELHGVPQDRGFMLHFQCGLRVYKVDGRRRVAGQGSDRDRLLTCLSEGCDNFLVGLRYEYERFNVRRSIGSIGLKEFSPNRYSLSTSVWDQVSVCGV